MSFEMAGFLVGMSVIGSALWLFYRFEANRIIGAINTGPGRRSRG